MTSLTASCETGATGGSSLMRALATIFAALPAGAFPCSACGGAFPAASQSSSRQRSGGLRADHRGVADLRVANQQLLPSAANEGRKLFPGVGRAHHKSIDARRVGTPVSVGLEQFGCLQHQFGSE